MSGVRRQARNFLEVRAVSSWRTPEAHEIRVGTGANRRIVGNVASPVN